MKRRWSLRAAVALTAGVTILAVASAGAYGSAAQNYLVVYKQSAVPADAASTIQKAGGSLVYSYGEIGVALARSDSSTFAATLSKNNKIEGVSESGRFATSLSDEQIDTTDAGGPLPGNVPVSDSDSLSGLQWDMVQIHTPEAHAITGGSPQIVVGDIDTGLDYTHPDLAANVDVGEERQLRQRRACAGRGRGERRQRPRHPHGRHDRRRRERHRHRRRRPEREDRRDQGRQRRRLLLPGGRDLRLHVGRHARHRRDEQQLLRRPVALQLPQRRRSSARSGRPSGARSASPCRTGRTVVAAAGNQADDLAHPTQDATSPDDTSPVLREIHNDCAVVPVEVPGVIGVTANGNQQLKSFYSSYGVGSADVVAPGGDSILQLTAAAPNGRVLSTWPASLLTVTCLPARRVVDASGATYCYQQGTSMASPHVAGSPRSSQASPGRCPGRAARSKARAIR